MSKEHELEDVLEGYAVETPEGNDPAILKIWMDRYPEHADDLLAFAADRSRIRHMPDIDLSDTEINAALERGRIAISSFRELAKKKPSEISSLTASAKELGLDRAALAKAVGLSISLLVYLDNRRVRAASVPSKVISALAAAVGASAEAVRAYLELPQTAGSLNYKAEGRPSETGPREFSEAVLQDQTLTDEEKKALLE